MPEAAAGSRSVALQSCADGFAWEGLARRSSGELRYFPLTRRHPAGTPKQSSSVGPNLPQPGKDLSGWNRFGLPGFVACDSASDLRLPSRFCSRFRFKVHALQKLAGQRKTLFWRQDERILSNGIKCGRHGHTTKRCFQAVESGKVARNGDPKLSDRGARRGSCTAGGKEAAEAADVTCTPVDYSA